MIDEVYFDESTLDKVLVALTDVDLSVETAQEAITSMQNMGILFRERK